MSLDPAASRGFLSIADTERETGLPKDTLRMWERRYGFPTPERNRIGDRQYTADQVERLCLVKRVLALGHRPGRVVALAVDELRRLEASAPGVRSDAMAPVAPALPTLESWLGSIRDRETAELRGALRHAILTLGLSRFVLELAAPLTEAVGEAWARGSLEVFEEHGFTQALGTALRDAIDAAAGGAQAGQPKVLLTTLPGEQHVLGLTMAEALWVIEGARCEPLGAQTPVHQTALAARARRADIVALSCSAWGNGHQIVASVIELRSLLPSSTQLWVGGSAPFLHRRPIDGVRIFDRLDAAVPALRAWRAARMP